MIVKLVIDFEIDHLQLSIFNFYFITDTYENKFIIPNPNIGTIEQYDKLRKGIDCVINYYNDNRELLSIVLQNDIVKFNITTKFGNSEITVPWIDCKTAFKQAYHWKLYF